MSNQTCRLFDITGVANINVMHDLTFQLKSSEKIISLFLLPVKVSSSYFTEEIRFSIMSKVNIGICENLSII